MGQEPQGGKECDHADVHRVVVGNTKPVGVAADKPDVDEEQQKDAAQIAGTPPNAGDPADRRLGGDVDQHRVVLDLGELEEHVAGR